jgi:hypothetical protein
MPKTAALNTFESINFPRGLRLGSFACFEATLPRHSQFKFERRKLLNGCINEILSLNLQLFFKKSSIKIKTASETKRTTEIFSIALFDLRTAIRSWIEMASAQRNP